jgi:hypothetical protein
VMDAAGSERAALMGTVDAGRLALAFAAEHPERTSSVIAFEAAPRFTPSPEDDFGVVPQVLARMAQATRDLDMETHLSIVAPSRMEEPGFSSWFRRFTRSASSGVPIEGFIAQTMSWDIRDRLAEIHVPVLVLNRDQQPILPMRNARALADALPNGQLVELPGQGAAIFSTDVDAVADEIQAFLTGARPPPRHDRVLSTVLFTDIVGSTERADDIGDGSWHRGAYRRTDLSAGRRRRSSRLVDREGSRHRLGHRVRRPWDLRAEGRARRMAGLRGRAALARPIQGCQGCDVRRAHGRHFGPLRACSACFSLHPL